MHKVKKKRRFQEKDFKHIADQICQQYKDRKKNRKDREKQWKEVDRQLRMEPDVSHKLRNNGSPDPDRAWMPEMELPYQAQALEILVADSRRLKFPDHGPWFESHAERSREYVEKVQSDPPFIISPEEAGVLGEKKMVVDQESANQIVTSWMMFLHNQYDFKKNWDIIDAEGFKYGSAFPRARFVNKRVFMMTDKGVVSKATQIPMLVPTSTWDVFPDDRVFSLNGEGEEISPGMIQHKTQSYDDLITAAEKGTDDPDDINGGWMPKRLAKIDRPDSGKLEILEYEGDLVVPRSRDSLYIPNTIITVAMNEGSGEVIRVRFNKFESSTYVPVFYHIEDPRSAYGSSPLTKGMPIQKAAADALNRTIMGAAYHGQPALQYDADDPNFAKTGGPQLYPGAAIPSTGDIKEIKIGDLNALSSVYFALVSQYESLTGTQAPRLGAQTNSHTTAFSKQQEIVRGTIRTVDYVRSVNNGPMQKWLQLCYHGSKKVMGNKDYSVFNYENKTYIERLNKDHLPDNVHFEVYGASTAAEDAAQSGAEVNALQGALNVEMIARQLGEDTGLSIIGLQKRLLEKGKVPDVAELYAARNEGASTGSPQQPGMGGSDQFDPGASSVLLQNLRQ